MSKKRPKGYSPETPVRSLSADGSTRRKWFSEADAIQLLERGLVVGRRNRKGRITAIQFGLRPGKVVVAPRAGTRYSFQASIANRKVWAHRNLPVTAVCANLGDSAAPEQVDNEVRNLIYGAVTLSVSAPVLSIEDIRRSRKKKQPVKAISIAEAA